MYEDAHLEAAYEDRNGGSVDTAREEDFDPLDGSGYDETLNSVCTECGARAYMQCAPWCPFVIGEEG